MKKEIEDLLKQDDGMLQINELFALHRWILHKETDFLGRDEDHLELVMTNKYGKTRSGAVRIESRDIDGIIADVRSGINSMMDDFKDTLLKSWNGGYLF